MMKAGDAIARDLFAIESRNKQFYLRRFAGILSGTSSMPQPPHGWHRPMRLIAS